ncbi:hypothetical protein M0534_10905 [Methylonatrum kenyense]|uniref:hypothetical protein n=1 Tax=Methylonatrum kenyense TaxID=455253 RepID=UPI0020C021F8|nr:hypothetical protein [Methylonatrum kenyense]MCK8516826.1 hypothetical protein [Methylonatrum kenyense]
MTNADNDLKAALLPGLGAGLMVGAVALIVITALLPHRPAWMPDDPALEEHAAALLVTADDRLLMGTQSGRIWLHDDGWQPYGNVPGDRAVTRLGLHEDRLLIAAPDGLFDLNGRVDAVDGRISDIRAFDTSLLAGGALGVLQFTEDGWQDTGLQEQLAEPQVYRVWQDQAGHQHAGTIGEGIWSRTGADASWRANRDGLSDPVNVFAFAETANGILLAGTDQGVYWQAETGAAWRALHGSADRDTRYLDLLIDDREPDTPMLLGATDDGVVQVRLIPRDNWLETRGGLERLAVGPPGLDGSVSHLAIKNDDLWAAAGSVYRFQPVAPAMRLPLILFSGILLGLGAFLLGMLRWRVRD